MNLFDYYKNNKNVTVNINEEYGLASIKYINLGVDWTEPHILDARGLIIDFDGNIIARPYPKFFNYKQLSSYTSLPQEVRNLSEWNSDLEYVMDKADGSLVIAYTHNKKLMLSSSGNVFSEHSKLFYKLLDSYPESTRNTLFELGKKYTINMEYVSPFNQIVIPYNETKFILHGARETDSGKFVSLEKLKEFSVSLGIELIKVYDEINSLDSLLSELKTLDNKEGFVASFADGFRLKFKTNEYVALHSLYSPLMTGRLTKAFIESIVEMIIDDTFDDYISTVETFESDEKRERGRKIIVLTLDFIEKYNDLFLKLSSYVKEVIELNDNRRDIALTIKTMDPIGFFSYNYGLELMSMFLKCDKDVELDEVLKKSRMFKTLFTDELRNVLTDNV